MNALRPHARHGHVRPRGGSTVTCFGVNAEPCLAQGDFSVQLLVLRCRYVIQTTLTARA